jgi:hypothetical protein
MKVCLLVVRMSGETADHVDVVLDLYSVIIIQTFLPTKQLWVRLTQQSFVITYAAIFTYISVVFLNSAAK